MPVPAGVPTTVSDAVREATEAIARAAVGDTPRLDAELLVGNVLGLDRVGLRVHDDRVLDPEAWQRLDELVGRRVAGEPIAYLLGTAWFFGREFEVDARVLIPRPETEALVGIVLDHADRLGRPIRVVDACTGSGCIAVTVAAELGDRASVAATDLSADALDVASANAVRHGVTVDLLEGDLLAPAVGRGPVDVIVANPPYVEPDDAGLEQAVRDHEPHLALFVPGGEGFPAFVTRLAAEAAGLLAPGGVLAIEHGIGQRDLVLATFAAAGFVDVQGVDDLAGIDRLAIGRQPTEGA